MRVGVGAFLPRARVLEGGGDGGGLWTADGSELLVVVVMVNARVARQVGAERNLALITKCHGPIARG